MKIRFLLAASVVSIAAAGFSTSVAAQSTGSTEFDDNTIVVTGSINRDVGGVEIPNTPRAKQELNEEIIRAQRPGQTVNDVINLVPGVSFQNNDPWGSSGGGFTIRGFGADRVSQTLDGLPLNDSGNYALYTNQQVDSEVLERVVVNLGTTDVDSPTASASGGTINIRTRRPSDEMGFTGTASYGDVLASGAENTEYYRVFGMFDTGDITGNGLTAFGSVSYTNYGTPYNPYGEIKKSQYNARIYQELGGGGDFISISGHYNANRNNFAGSQRLSTLLDFADDPDFEGEDRFSVFEGAGVFPCAVDSSVLVGGGGGTNGVSDRYNDRGDCGAAFYRRFNPSDTGNVRINSLFNITDNLTFTFDPSYQYVKANGGGPDDLREGTFDGLTGAFRGGYYFGRDLNGDGDLLDRIAGNDPSQTTTDRYGIVANLIYDIAANHRVRLAYTLDHARHRQTGQITSMQADGTISDPFAIDSPLLDVRGNEVNKRDRLSYAILNQVSAEYAGRFGDLTAVFGLRAPFFTRELNQNCYTTSINGFVNCPSPGQDLTQYELDNPDHVPPLSREYNYNRLLPSVGFTYDITDDVSAFGNFSRGISVPGTDPLYDSLFIPDDDRARPVPETTDSFDLGLRYQNGIVQAQLSAWYTRYDDRLASAFDPTARDGEGAVVFRNLGRVDKYGLDGSFSIAPTDNTTLYLFGSINESDIQDDVQTGLDMNDQPIFVPTSGNAESGTPNFTVGARGTATIGDLELGAQVKHTGPRWVNDLNTDRAPAYTLVDFDLRYNIVELANGTNAAVQINVTNLFDEYYVGFFGGSLDGFGFAQIGAPRAASVTLLVGF